MDFGRSVSAALDPVLVPEGFAAGQYGGGQVIFCADHDELSDRFPALPQSNAQVRGLGCCIDLVVDYDDQDVRQVSLEANPLADTLRALRPFDGAAIVERIAGAPPDAALPALAGVLSGLFRTAAA